MQIPYILQPLLHYKAIDFEMDEQLTIVHLQKDLYTALLNELHDKFEKFCNHIIRLQDFRFKLNNTFGCESVEDFPEEQQKLFRLQVFDPNVPLRPLPKNEKNVNDPGVVIQECLRMNNPKAKLLAIIQDMPWERFKRFFIQIACLAYFSALESGSYFTTHTQLFDEDDRRLSLIDDDFLGEKDLPDII